jgi:hypothetical protein
MADRQIAVADRFAIATDGIQWVLQRRKGKQSHATSFVRSRRSILARCLREAGATAIETDTLIADLPDNFDAHLSKMNAPAVQVTDADNGPGLEAPRRAPVLPPSTCGAWS